MAFSLESLANGGSGTKISSKKGKIDWNQLAWKKIDPNSYVVDGFEDGGLFEFEELDGTRL
jgi:hypothetical protein